MMVAGMAAYTDISKAHEVANEVRRVHKQLKEAQANAQTYNNRERLFGMPVTNVNIVFYFIIAHDDVTAVVFGLLQYDKLSRLAKEFEPFKNLWLTTSDWLRWHESWMHDPLTSIDSETVEKNVNDAYKTMHKSTKLFAEIPGRFKQPLCTSCF